VSGHSRKRLSGSGACSGESRSGERVSQKIGLSAERQTATDASLTCFVGVGSRGQFAAVSGSVLVSSSLVSAKVCVSFVWSRSRVERDREIETEVAA